MDYIRQLGPVVLDHRLRRVVDSLLRSAEEIYEATGLPFRARWASTYTLLRDNGPMPIGQIAERLRLTHPAVIGITSEMSDADIVTATSDPRDARRRLVELTARGEAMAPELSVLWKRLGEAQRKRFEAAGCDIMKVLEKLEDGLAERPLSEEVLGKSRLAPRNQRKVRAKAALLLALSISASLLPLNGEAQQATSATVNADRRAKLVNALSDSLINGYIYEETGRRAADSLKAELRSGQYDSFTNGNELVKRINETLRRVANDKHLGVQFRPAGSTPMRRVMSTPMTPPERPVGISRIICAPELGIPFAQILDGNIGYMEISGFSGNPDALAVVDSVMTLFADAKAIIIDLGRNRGGGPPLIQHLSGYFFEKPVHLVSSIMRGMDQPMERWSSEKIPGKKLPKVPVYILTSRLTISAAESFAFGLRNHNRVEIIGERTAGGGHFGDFVPLTDGFTVFLPRGRTYNPATNEGWEAEGLKPHIEVPYEKALSTAIARARRGPLNK